MNDFDNEYERISSLTNNRLVAKELKEKTLEFREEYQKKRKKEINKRYQLKKKEFKKPEPEPEPEPEPVTFNDSEMIESEKVCPIFMKILGIYIKYNPDMKNPLAKVRYLMDFVNKKQYYTFYIYKYHSYIANHLDDIFNDNPDDLVMFYNIFNKFMGKLSGIAFDIKNKLIKEGLIKESPDNYKNDKLNNDLNFDKQFLINNYFEKLKDLSFLQKIIYILMFLHEPRFTLHAVTKGVKYDDLDLTTLPDDIVKDLEKYKTFDYLVSNVSHNTIITEFKKITNILYGFPYGIQDIKHKYNKYILFNTSSS